MKAIALTLLALILPVSSAWAGSDYFANLTVNKAGSGKGKVYIDSEERNYLVKSSSSSSSPVNVSFTIKAEAEVGSQFAGWTAGDGVTLSSTALAQTTATISSNSTTTPGVAGKVTATFNEITYSPFQVTFSAPVNGSYTVDGVTVGAGGLVSEKKTKVYQPMLIATAASGYAFNGWYEGTTKKSASPTYTPAFTAATTIRAEFAAAVLVTTYDELVNSLKNNTCTAIQPGTEIVVESGKTLSVPSGKTLIVNGALWIEGTFSNSGSVAIGGTLAKLTKSFIQKGQNGETGEDAQPYNPYGTVKYWVTSAETVSGVSVSGATASSFVRITNGKGTVYRAVLGANSPVAIICSKDSSAQNLVTGITNTSQTDIIKVLSNYTMSLHILCKDASDSSRTLKADYAGVTDLAGYKLTIGSKGVNSYTHTILNGSYEMTIPSSTGGLYGTLTCINCSAIKIANFVNKYWTTMNFYDCTPADYVTAFEKKEVGTAGNMNYYSGGPYPIASIKTPVDLFHIYGGSWTGKPDAARIATSLQGTHEFCQHEDGYWYLEPKQGSEVVVVDGVKYADMSSAVAAISSAFSSKASVKMVMSKNATLASAITVPNGKTLEIELAGCCITAPNGLVTNNGTLIIGDKNMGLTSVGGRVVTSGGNWITNNGSADITYGYYDGNISLNGGTFTTHHGWFTGAISGAAEYANLRGGYFEKNVSVYLKDGFLQTSSYVGQFPKASVSKTFSSTYWKYTIKLLPSADLTLYLNTETSKDKYTDANWKRKAEIKSMVQPYLTTYTIDYTIAFDRNVASNSVTAKVEKPSVVGDRKLDQDVKADGLYRVLSPQLSNPGIAQANQKSYTDCFADSTFHEVVFGVVPNTDGNKGTTANLRVDFCQGAVGYDISKLTTKLNIASEYTVMGAGTTNQAMIQPASGKATFYATVAEAIAACAEGGTIKLCNDITSTDTITVSKACTIDVNGMVFNGAFAASAGLVMSVTESTPNIEKYLGKNHKVYTFKPGLIFLVK